MSAFTVNTKHIDALLTWASRPKYQAPAYYYWQGKKVDFFGNLDAIGQRLVNQNHASVNYRYNELEVPPVYAHQRYSLSLLDPVRIIKACDCYAYQACETDNWKETEAHEIIEAIRERAIDELPGYQEAAWEIQ